MKRGSSPFGACLILGLAILSSGFVSPTYGGDETLPPLEGDRVPDSFEAMWGDFDPRAEPLDVEVLHEWEEDGVELKVLRYRIGVFKGQKAMMAAVYGRPKGQENLPGLVQIHGGGQYGHANACLTNARRGYATISIAWAGRLSAPDYHINPQGVALFWEGKTDDPAYKLTTDWGALDAYHAPCRNAGHSFLKIGPAEWTLDPVESPRNNSWFLCALGARRALTFLEQQPEADGDRLGVYGHSMGGKLTVFTAASDDRVKAAVPSCGGISDRGKEPALYDQTVGDTATLPHVTCPILFLSPANDFHGRVEDLPAAIEAIQSEDWRIVSTPHLNHRDPADAEVGTQLWFDQYLKGEFEYPATPESVLTLKTDSGVPRFEVIPDPARPYRDVEIYYSQVAPADGSKGSGVLDVAKGRFWHHAPATQQGDSWRADLPVYDTEAPLMVYANVRYALEEPIAGAGYYYGDYKADGYKVSSLIEFVEPSELQAAGVKATFDAGEVIESFAKGWEKEWFHYKAEPWEHRTNKLAVPPYRAPEGNTMLVFAVQSDEANQLIVGSGSHAAVVELKGGPDWQAVALDPAQFKDPTGAAWKDWRGFTDLRLLPQDLLKTGRGKEEKRKKLGGEWKGAAPTFVNLRWVVVP